MPLFFWDEEKKRKRKEAEHARSGEGELSIADPRRFLHRVPEKDAAGLLLPPWKRYIMARELSDQAVKEEKERRRLQAEEDMLAQLPVWKRVIVERQQAEIRAMKERETEDPYDVIGGLNMTRRRAKAPPPPTYDEDGLPMTSRQIRDRLYVDDDDDDDDKDIRISTVLANASTRKLSLNETSGHELRAGQELPIDQIRHRRHTHAGEPPSFYAEESDSDVYVDESVTSGGSPTESNYLNSQLMEHYADEESDSDDDADHHEDEQEAAGTVRSRYKNDPDVVDLEALAPPVDKSSEEIYVNNTVTKDSPVAYAAVDKSKKSPRLPETNDVYVNVAKSMNQRRSTLLMEGLGNVGKAGKKPLRRPPPPVPICRDPPRQMSSADGVAHKKAPAPPPPGGAVSQDSSAESCSPDFVSASASIHVKSLR